MKFYSDWALRIAHGQWTDHKAFYGLPGYAFCLAAIYQLSGGLDPFTVGMLQALMDAGVAALLCKIARDRFRPVRGRSQRRRLAMRKSRISSASARRWLWMFFTPAQAFPRS